MQSVADTRWGHYSVVTDFCLPVTMNVLVVIQLICWQALGAKMTLTDADDEAIVTLQTNAAANRSNAAVARLDWSGD